MAPTLRSSSSIDGAAGEGSTAIQNIAGRATPLRGSDIDTDRIIPARYLKVIRFDGLGEYAFYDERHDQNGQPRAHPLNDQRYRGSQFLIVEHNFGCGSSREHAPQSLMRFGFRAFVGISFAEIFQGNCLALGLPAVTLPATSIHAILDMVEQNPATELQLDLSAVTLTVGDQRYDFTQAAGARQSLLMGTWDSTSLLLQNRADIVRVAKHLPYIDNFANTS